MADRMDPTDLLLDSVSGGEPVDWERAQSGAESAEQRDWMRALRDVERVAAFHRTLQRDDSGGDAPTIQRWGELLLLERRGSGASSEVYRAWDPTLQREVALKLLRARDDTPADVAPALEEARALARVRDAHVVTVHGAAEHEGRAGLWMEYLHGATLAAEIERRGALPAVEVARLGEQLGRALAAVHAAGVLHRDVKPANIALEPAGRAVLMDFGLGRRRAVNTGEARPFSGTPMFMSPQRLAGSPGTASDDLYALGATLFFALAGRAPFDATSLEALRAAVAKPLSPALATLRPDAPRALVRAIERAMAAEPRDRFENALELSAAFAAAAPSAANGRRAPWLAIVGGTALLAALVAFALLRAAAHPTPAGAPPARIPPTTYDVSAQLVRRSGAGSIALESGDRVRPGDRISLQFRGSQRLWVYVLDADERGESYLLFPQPFFDRRNPLPADSAFVLPGTLGGHENAWTVTSRGGREHFLVVASPEPVAELEQGATRLAAPVPGRPIEYARIGSGELDRLRGVGGLAELPPAAPPRESGTSPLFERIRALAGQEQSVRGTWVRQVTLENPLR